MTRRCQGCNADLTGHALKWCPSCARKATVAKARRWQARNPERRRSIWRTFERQRRRRKLAAILDKWR